MIWTESRVAPFSGYIDSNERPVVLTAVRRSGAQAFRYVFVGLIVYGLDLGTFVVLTFLGARPAPANVIARATGALCGFILHGTFTFGEVSRWCSFTDASRHLSFPRFLRYCALFAINAAGTTLLLVLALDHFRWSPVPTRITVDVISIVLAFLVSKYLVFSGR